MSAWQPHNEAIEAARTELGAMKRALVVSVLGPKAILALFDSIESLETWVDEQQAIHLHNEGRRSLTRCEIASPSLKAASA